MPTVAGIVTIICGCLAMFGFLALLLFALFFNAIPDIQHELDDFPLFFVQIAFALGALCSLVTALVALFGGISAIQRRRWPWVLAGAISALLICPPLGLAAVILVVLAEGELRPAA